MSGDVAELEKKIGHEFSDKSLLRGALTHSSTGADQNYERLEFLGDRVLGLVIAEILYAKFPQEPEGDLARRLSALVQGTWLAKMGQLIDLGTYMNFSDSERAAGGNENENLIADGMEALIGAIYLDAGLVPCRHFIQKLWGDNFETMTRPPRHPKTELQEWAQAQNLPLPAYKIIGQNGPDHAPLFELELSVHGHSAVKAEGKSRSAAEKAAAQLFLDYLKESAADNE